MPIFHIDSINKPWLCGYIGIQCRPAPRGAKLSSSAVVPLPLDELFRLRGCHHLVGQTVRVAQPR